MILEIGWIDKVQMMTSKFHIPRICYLQNKRSMADMIKDLGKRSLYPCRPFKREVGKDKRCYPANFED
jgi:hypothetical protein